MSTWTRKDDALIAKRCEGLEVELIAEEGLPKYYVCYPPGEPVKARDLYRYSTDHAAALRAAEAWRKKKPGRWYECRSEMEDQFGTKIDGREWNEVPEVAQEMQK